MKTCLAILFCAMLAGCVTRPVYQVEKPKVKVPVPPMPGQTVSARSAVAESAVAPLEPTIIGLVWDIPTERPVALRLEETSDLVTWTLADSYYTNRATVWRTNFGIQKFYRLIQY